MVGQELPHFQIKISDLVGTPDEQNANKMSDEDFALLVNSIDQNGFLQDILVQRRPDGKWDIVDGNHRVKAAKKAGYTAVTAIEWDGTAEMKRVLGLSMNRLRGDLNLGIAARTMNELADAGWTAQELTLTGFSVDDIEKLLKTAVASAEEILEGQAGELVEPAEPTESEGPFILELVFADKAEMQKAKRGLRKVVGKGRELSEALLVLLNSKD